MGASFCVLDEGWIPVIDEEGRHQLFGIRETLENAHRLKGISDPSPMIEYSLYRFLSVFLMDALRPERIETLEELLEQGAFDMEDIETYIAQCRNEGVTFDLFDSDRPFLQAGYDETWDKEKKPVSVLDYTLPSGNNHTHFDHRSSDTVSASAGEAARLLLSAQLFCTAGTQGPSNVNASPPYYTVVTGVNLFETMVFSLSVLNRIQIPFDNPPVLWRSNEKIEPKKVVPNTSWLYGMLFPARRIQLIPDNGGATVSHVYLGAGLNFSNKEIWEDPFVTYRLNKTGKSPWRPKQDRAVWRNLNDLMEVPHRRAPYVLQQYLEMETDVEQVSLLLYGVETSQASYLSTSYADLKIPVTIAQEAQLACVTGCIAAAERVEQGLKKGLSETDAVPESVVKQAVQEYYDACERAFWHFCNSALAEENADLPDCYQRWCRSVGDCAVAAWNRVSERLQLRGRSLTKLAQNERYLFAAMKKIKEGIANA